VKVDGAQVPRDEANGWSYRESSRAIVFNGAGVPPPGAEIEIAYDVDL
jgi:hypothetical protein